MQEKNGESRFITSGDGLRLHYREYNSAYAGPAAPLVCLTGLARTAMDFDVLAKAIAFAPGHGRRVIAIDYRGRGLSGRDSNWRNYDMRVENADILSILAAARIEHAVFLGTSRGGLHIMMLGAIRPGAIRAAIINDIGPVIEAKGLMRIRGYVGKLPQPASWDDAVQLAKQIMSAQFTGLSEDEWRAYAEITFEEQKGRLVPRYDPALSRPLAEMNLEQGVPVLWPQFDGLRGIPLLAIRGENSDLFSRETLDAMATRHPACETYTVGGQGHAPLLLDHSSIERIAQFVSRF